MIRFGKVQAVGYLLYRQAGKQQIVLYLLQQALLQQMYGRQTKLPHNSLIERHPADIHQLCIIIHMRFLGNMLFKKFFIVIGIVIERWSKRQVKTPGIKSVQLQQELIQISNNHMITVGYRLAQFPFHLP